jgi:hypothetical protein
MKEGIWTIAVCPERLVEPVSNHDAVDAQGWIDYWCAHMDCHIIVMANLHEIEKEWKDPFTVEQEVDEMLYDLAENTFSKASKIMMDYLERAS